MGALRRHALLATLVVPAVTAGAVAAVVAAESRAGLLVFAAMVAGVLPFAGLAAPLRARVAWRLMVAFSGPVVAFTVALAVDIPGRYALSTAGLAAALLCGALASLLASAVGARAAARSPSRVAVVGARSFAEALQVELDSHRVRTHEVIGWFDRRDPERAAEGSGAPGAGTRLASLSDVREAVVAERIDLLVLAPDMGPPPDAASATPSPTRGGLSTYERIANECLDLPVRLVRGQALYEELFGHVPVGAIDAAWYMFIMHPSFSPTPVRGKRAMDAALAILIGAAMLPVLAIAAIGIRTGDGGRAIYRQRRVGEHGREFEILKLRTMVADAETSGPSWSSPDDERVTRLGRVLRRLHIDEVPQLWNVLRGEMTLVGPRPERPELVAELERQYDHYERRHLLKPGLTGWAQVSSGYGGSQVGTAMKLSYDLYYLKHQSLLADLLIVLETAFSLTRDQHRDLEVPVPDLIGAASEPAPLSETPAGVPIGASVMANGDARVGHGSRSEQPRLVGWSTE